MASQAPSPAFCLPLMLPRPSVSVHYELAQNRHHSTLQTAWLSHQGRYRAMAGQGWGWTCKTAGSLAHTEQAAPGVVNHSLSGQGTCHVSAVAGWALLSWPSWARLAWKHLLSFGRDCNMFLLFVSFLTWRARGDLRPWLTPVCR